MGTCFLRNCSLWILYDQLAIRATVRSLKLKLLLPTTRQSQKPHPVCCDICGLKTIISIRNTPERRELCQASALWKVRRSLRGSCLQHKTNSLLSIEDNGLFSRCEVSWNLIRSMLLAREE